MSVLEEAERANKDLSATISRAEDLNRQRLAAQARYDVYISRLEQLGVTVETLDSRIQDVEETIRSYTEAVLDQLSNLKQMMGEDE